MAVGLLLLAACSTAEVEPGPMTSFDDIAGTTYERQGAGAPAYFHFFEDGTIHMSTNQDLVVDSPQGIHETRFEGTKVFLHQIKGSCDDNPADQVFDQDDATYEIDVLENGNLQLVAIEDPCGVRSGLFPAEYTPVP
jgi:hypothetical protein